MSGYMGFSGTTVHKNHHVEHQHDDEGQDQQDKP
jgi:hypothetical protein